MKERKRFRNFKGGLSNKILKYLKLLKFKIRTNLRIKKINKFFKKAKKTSLQSFKIEYQNNNPQHLKMIWSNYLIKMSNQNRKKLNKMRKITKLNCMQMSWRNKWRRKRRKRSRQRKRSMTRICNVRNKLMNRFRRKRRF